MVLSPRPDRARRLAIALALALPFGSVLARSYDEQLLDLQPATATSVSPEGLVLGQSMTWPCGATSACTSQATWSVWQGLRRQALPGLEGLTPVANRIGPHGVVAGHLIDSSGRSHAAKWQQVGGAYQAMRLTESMQTVESVAVAVDAQGRTIGWRRLATGEVRPCLWTKNGVMRDLVRAGFPAGQPVDMSTNGWVLTATHRYQIDDPGSTTALPAWPAGLTPMAGQWRIDTEGRATGLSTHSTGEIRPLQLEPGLHATGTWAFWMVPGLPTSTGGTHFGGIASQGETVVTIGGTAMINHGGYELTPLAAERGLAPANVALTDGAGVDGSGRPVVALEHGGITRMARLLPQASAFTPAPYVYASGVTFATARLVDANPGGGSCGAGKAREVVATYTVRRANADGSFQVQRGARVRAALLTRAGGTAVLGTTNEQGTVTFTAQDLECDSPVQAWLQSVSLDGVPSVYWMAGRHATQAALLP